MLFKRSCHVNELFLANRFYLWRKSWCEAIIKFCSEISAAKRQTSEACQTLKVSLFAVNCAMIESTSDKRRENLWRSLENFFCESIFVEFHPSHFVLQTVFFSLSLSLARNSWKLRANKIYFSTCFWLKVKNVLEKKKVNKFLY